MNDPNVLRLLATQFGIVAATQLVDLGVSPSTISRARRRGIVDVILPGVLRASSHPPTFEARAMAVQLYTDPDGVLSGPTAARIHGVRRMPDQRIWVLTSQRTRSIIPDWVARSRSNWLVHVRDVTIVHGLRVLKPLPTLLKAAAPTRARHRRVDSSRPRVARCQVGRRAGPLLVARR